MTATRKTSPSPRKRLMLAATGVFLLAGILYGAWWLLFASHYESTDDAYVHGDLVQVSAQIPGTVIAIGARDTQQVAQGVRLVTLDDSDTAIALAQAQAALAQAVRRTRTLFVQNDALAADVEVSQANVEQSETLLHKAQNDLQRRSALRASGGVSGEELLHAQVAVKSAQAGLAQARAALAAARAKLGTNQALTHGSTVATHPDVLQAADHVRQAWLAHERTHILAPISGMVAQRSVQLGQRIQPGTPLMTLVPLDALWVEANFKENQLQAMVPGQKATLVSDLYGDRVTYHGTVLGVSAGSGSAFALLPAQNASGNWVKVIQRVPVRIRLEPAELREHPLRVGLSMTVRVDLAPVAARTGGAHAGTAPDAGTVSGSARDTAPARPAPGPANGTAGDQPAADPAYARQHTPVYDHDQAAVDAMIQHIIQGNL